MWVAGRNFEKSFKTIFVVPKTDALLIIIVSAVTVYKDLAIAVIVGVIVSALVFAWKSASRITATERASRTEDGAKVYEIEGPLFFSSTNSFLEIFKPNPELVIIFTPSKKYSKDNGPDW